MGDHVTTANLRIGLQILQLTTLQAGRSGTHGLAACCLLDDMGPYVSKLDICLQYSLEMVKDSRKLLMRFMRHITYQGRVFFTILINVATGFCWWQEAPMLVVTHAQIVVVRNPQVPSGKLT